MTRGSRPSGCACSARPPRGAARPRLSTADVVLPAAQAIAGTGPTRITYYAPYRKGGFTGSNTGRVWAATVTGEISRRPRLRRRPGHERPGPGAGRVERPAPHRLRRPTGRRGLRQRRRLRAAEPDRRRAVAAAGPGRRPRDGGHRKLRPGRLPRRRAAQAVRPRRAQGPPAHRRARRGAVPHHRRARHRSAPSRRRCSARSPSPRMPWPRPSACSTRCRARPATPRPPPSSCSTTPRTSRRPTSTSSPSSPASSPSSARPSTSTTCRPRSTPRSPGSKHGCIAARDATRALSRPPMPLFSRSRLDQVAEALDRFAASADLVGDVVGMFKGLELAEEGGHLPLRVDADACGRGRARRRR